MKYTLLAFVLLATGLESFKPKEAKEFTFLYPNLQNSTIALNSDVFKKFSKEWRGTDYYYYSENDGFICSVLFYKLNSDEKLMLVDGPRAALGTPAVSPAYPYTYFSTNSNFKAMEQHEDKWGEPTDNFMFRQNDIVLQASHVSQKNM